MFSKRMGAAAVGLSVLLALTACTAPSGNESGGEDLVVALGEPIIGLDVIQHPASLSSRTVMRHVFETLVQANDEGGYEGLLAENWEIEDPLTWRFDLRQGVKFHDGSDFTSADVVATFEALKAGSAPTSPLFKDMNMTADGDFTVRVDSEKPIGTMLANMAQLFITTSEHLAAAEPDASEAIGTGPYELDSFVLDQGVVIVRDDDYWGDSPLAASIEFKDIPEASARAIALSNEEIDIALALPSEQLASLEDDPNVTIERAESYGIHFVWFNNSVDHVLEDGSANPFADVRVRQAMRLAVDSQELADAVLDGLAVPATAPIASSVFGSVSQGEVAQDIDAAKALLAEAGYPNGFETSIDATDFVGGRAMSEALAGYWNQIGVTVEVKLLERSTWEDRIGKALFDMTTAPNFTSTGDADYSLNRLYTCANARLGYCNPEVDSLLQSAAAETDQDKRLELYDEAEAILWEEVPAMWPIEVKASYAWRTSVTGFVATPDQTPSLLGVLP